MKRLRLGAVLHFIIAIGHICCLFALDEAFEAYGIREIMHQMVSGHVWMLYALAGGINCIYDFTWLQFFSSLVPAIIAWCYWPGIKGNRLRLQL
jgi:hypothetical protein